MNSLFEITFDKVEPFYLMEEGQIIFWANAIVHPTMPFTQLETIITSVVQRVKNNPRYTVCDAL
jgi:hypothetical protein